MILSKNKLLTCFVAIVTVLFLSAYASATTYYVNFEAGDDSLAGTSEATAWKHAPGVDRNLQPGDTVLFKGGVVYGGGKIFIPASGAPGNHITYKGDGWPGLEGEKAILENHMKGNYYNYITLEGFRVYNAFIGGGSTPGMNMIVRNNEISGPNGASGAISIGNGAVSIIENNYIHDITDTRGIYVDAKYGGKIVIRNNTFERTAASAIRVDAGGGEAIVVNNEFYDCAPAGHTNVITIYHTVTGDAPHVKNVLVAGNVVLGGQRCYTIHKSDDITVYNNILIAKEGSDSCPITVWWSGALKMKILNNVLLSGYNPPITLYGAVNVDDLTMKNNIMALPVNKPGADISHNIYTVSGSSSGTNEIYEPDLTKIFEDVSSANRADWDYHLKLGSPAIDAGTDITAILTELQEQYGEYYDFFKDIEGNPRPPGAVGGLYAEGEGAHTNTKASVQAFDMTVFWTLFSATTGATLILIVLVILSARYIENRHQRAVL